jgi:hypothetical protein
MKKIILIILIVFTTSCASRKVIVDKTDIKKDSVSKVDIKIIEKDGTTVEIKNNVSIDEITIKPIDSTKSIIVDGKYYKNVVLTIKKTKDNSLRSETKTASKIEHKRQTVNTHVVKKEKKKEIDKKANYFIYLWLLLIPLGYYIYRRAMKMMLL